MNPTNKEEYKRYGVDVVSSSNGDSSAPSSSYMAEFPWSSNGEDKATVIAEVKQQVERRLKALEEEAESSKEAILKGLEERKKLMHEIYVHLNFIHCAHSPHNQVAESDSWQKTLNVIVKRFKRARCRAGLSQVLEQEVEQGQLVARDVKVNTTALQTFCDLSSGR